MIDSFKGPTRWLSNFGTCNIWAFGQLVSTTEHGYQAAKCEDIQERAAILDAETPGKAKRMGQKVVLRADWEDVKEQVMYTLQRRKFANDYLQEKLLDTGEQCLVEGNDWGDRCWGAEKVPTGEGITYTDPPWWPEDGSNDYKWVGENRLGVILMRVRSELRDLRGL